MEKVMGADVFTFAEAAELYGVKVKNWWRIFRRINAPWIQPSGKGGKVYFPKVQFEIWMAKGRNK